MKIFEYLSSVKKRPDMYMSNGACLSELECQLHGYEAALRMHDVKGDLVEFNHSMREFVYKKTNWSTACGWAAAITENTESPAAAVSRFFELANQFIYESQGIENAISEKNAR